MTRCLIACNKVTHDMHSFSRECETFGIKQMTWENMDYF